MSISTNPDQRKSNERWPAWRIQLHNIIFDAKTVKGRAFDIVLLILISLSILVVMLETVESIDSKYHSLINAMEWILTVFFTIEYLLRLYTVRKPIHYAKSAYGLIDLLAILPSYISLFVPGGGGFMIIRALRLLRVFRILKLVRFSNASNVLMKAVIQSRYKIIVFMIFVITLVVLIGSVMYLVESPHNDGFANIPKSMYWAIVTLTTVGYGDISPTTPFGQFLASVIMVLGYGIIAVPTGIVTSELSKVNDEHQPHENFNEACMNCGAENHQLNAEYCFKCGYKLD